MHCTSEVNTAFAGGDLFLVRKGDEHCFQIVEASELYVLKYSEKTRLWLKDTSSKLHEVAVAPIKAKSPLNAKVSFSDADRALLDELFQFMLFLSEDTAKNENLLFLQMIALVSVIERNLQFSPSLNDVPQNKMLIRLILKHINRNLREPDKLSLNTIAEQFNMSTNKLGAYFRQETGHSVKQFINASRMTVVGERISKSERSFSEIAYEFGFVDESHLNKMFKKHFGKTPTEYRRESINPASASTKSE